MSDEGPENKEVGKPFMTQLKNLGWDVTDLGSEIPQDSATNFHSNLSKQRY